MKALHLLVVSATMAPLLIFTATSAEAHQRPAGSPQIVPIVNGGEFQRRRSQDRPIHGGGRRIHGIGGVFVVEREVVRVIEREVVREVPAPPAEPPPPPRKPYVIGKSYASLPGGCMKLIDQGVSYYGCSGEWYRQIGSGSAVQYQAVAQP